MSSSNIDTHNTVMAGSLLFCLLVVVGFGSGSGSGRIGLGLRLLARDKDEAWLSDNGTFAFGFTQAHTPNLFQLAIWFADLPGDPTVVWSPNRYALCTVG